MAIPQALVHRFSEAVRSRGEAYYRDGLVWVQHVTPSRIDAKVQGTDRYDVRIARVGKKAADLACRCTCPYALDFGPCKHMWATLREADETVGLPTAVEVADDDDDDVDDFDDDADLDDDDFADADPDPEDVVAPSVPPPRHQRAPGAPTPKPPAPARWKTQLNSLRGMLHSPLQTGGSGQKPWPTGKRLLYIADVPASLGRDGLVVELATETLQRDGSWGNFRMASLSREQWLAAPDLDDREIAQMLDGARAEHAYYRVNMSRRFVLESPAIDTALRRMCATGRCRLRLTEGLEEQPLQWDDGDPWELRLELAPRDDSARVFVGASLVRGGERVPLPDPSIKLIGTHVILRSTVARLIDHGARLLAGSLSTHLTLAAPLDEAAELLAELSTLPVLPPVDVDPSLGISDVRVRPSPRLSLHPTPYPLSSGVKVDGRLSFAYDGAVVERDHAASVFVDRERRRVVHRDPVAEAAAVERLRAAGFKREYDYGKHAHVERLLASKVPAVALALTVEGWQVETDGHLLRHAESFDLDVHSGIDWFDLDGGVSFGAVRASLPELLAAVRRGDRTVALGDGSVGIVPDEWLDRARALAMAAQEADGRLRFAKVQIGVLDALLATIPSATTDAMFARARAELTRFEGLAPADPEPTFAGRLRPYQSEGLGWLDFLRRFGFGGCLADDMGLGKTVEVLALLESRRSAGAGTSLVVVPRSLVFNWQREAARFTPQMRVMVHAGTQRARSPERLLEHDLVISTYGTLRRDAAWLREVEFEYVVLDEAQAIKNAATESAKAARLLRARHRLAMSGTPIENRLADLWSLFEFLNPGMLGRSAAFTRLAYGSGGGTTEPGGVDGRALIARAVRPFILRRTKQQVARDLPERLEQTLLVELSAVERALYDELRDHYRAALLGRIARDGIAKSKIQVLEALLRLRQAACHPGLIDKKRIDSSSSKLEVLETRLREVVAEGHKAVVFSQFTSLLAILRKKLETAGPAYEYLDGKTKDRAARVDRFQSDASCSVFLVSLRAGGLGLNLTAAEYVFLLDPWWNPAVEAQAIDRAHRIGQTQRVFATRLIARDTVEEKVVELQSSKRALADAIVREDDGLIGKLTREDLEALLA